MKNNKIPRKIRLQHRIWALENKIGVTEPIGGRNPYHRCVYCKRSQPEISYSGHYAGCPEPGYRKEVEHYRRLLDEDN